MSFENFKNDYFMRISTVKISSSCNRPIACQIHLVQQDYSILSIFKPIDGAAVAETGCGGRW